jgi:hypothetical protein
MKDIIIKHGINSSSPLVSSSNPRPAPYRSPLTHLSGPLQVALQNFLPAATRTSEVLSEAFTRCGPLQPFLRRVPPEAIHPRYPHSGSLHVQRLCVSRAGPLAADALPGEGHLWRAVGRLSAKMCEFGA